MAKKYTLPRHTNLASQGLRITAAIVDFAIAFALALVFYFAGFNLILKNTTQGLSDQLNNYQLESHLKIKNEDGTIGIIPNKDPADFEKALQGFYLRYLTGNGLDGETVAPNANEPINIDGKEVLPKDYYTVEFYNTKVLGISQDNPDGEQSTSYWTYEKDDQGNFLKNKLAIRRSQRYNPDTGQNVKLTDTDFLVAYQPIYVASYALLISQNFYKNTANNYYFYYTMGIVFAALLSAIVCYIVMPIILKNGSTIGKKIFKLGLATYDGYKFSNYQLLLRLVPFAIMDLAMLIPVWSSILLVVSVFLVVLLTSFALMMASPKKAALHDFAARTIVVDLKSSIIFLNEIEEENYINKEDGIVKEEYYGEEPELRYEK